ncbi:hypothetical protein EV178_003739 [Coemansia sp. RSA 1646]|nr:hypothetical protein EV178_003739 [Coemansia sp. RSA 1646]
MRVASTEGAAPATYYTVELEPETETPAAFGLKPAIQLEHLSGPFRVKRYMHYIQLPSRFDTKLHLIAQYQGTESTDYDLYAVAVHDGAGIGKESALLLSLALAGASSLRDSLNPHAFSNPNFAMALSGMQLQQLAKTSKEQNSWLDIEEGELLAPVLVPRQIGSPGYYTTQDLITTTLSKLGYAISWDNFTTSTPVGQVPMSNIIATKNPGASRRLILAAHYESKVVAGGDFIGATDSAVPVALILDIAQGLAKNIDQMASSDIALQLIFFDGEEAYVEWTSTDSLYGARHLAELWEHSPDPATAAALSSSMQQKPELERIDVMVLLDLIGAPNNAFVPLQAPTAELFMELSSLEHRLYDAGYISRTYMNISHPIAAEYIEDDHIPFIKRNIPVLHLISRPFPMVWHKLADNASALDSTVIADMSLILRSFVASYLRLSV